MKNLTWQNPEQLFVAQELINKVKSKCCGIKDIQTGEGEEEGYEYEKHWDYGLIIIERIKQSQYFGETQKDWFIYQNGGYSELYPELKCYANHFQWSSKEYSEVDIIEIAKKIASAITYFYIKREEDYRGSWG